MNRRFSSAKGFQVFVIKLYHDIFFESIIFSIFTLAQAKKFDYLLGKTK